MPKVINNLMPGNVLKIIAKKAKNYTFDLKAKHHYLDTFSAAPQQSIANLSEFTPSRNYRNYKIPTNYFTVLVN